MLYFSSVWSAGSKHASFDLCFNQRELIQYLIYNKMEMRVLFLSSAWKSLYILYKSFQFIVCVLVIKFGTFSETVYNWAVDFPAFT